MYKDVTIYSKGKPITITPISTGSVSMKTKAHTIRRHPLLFRAIDIVRDSEFTPFLPVLTWLIRHPEGLFLIDAGYDARVNDPGYFRGAGVMERWFMRSQVRVKMRPEDELALQLQSRGISPRDIDTVVFTHLHVDHVGGIPAFRGSSFIVDETEFRHNSHGFLLPAWFDPIRIKQDRQAAGHFPQGHALTKAEDLILVPMPGHTRGHCCVHLRTDEIDILFAGDVVYGIEQLRDGRFAAPDDVKSAQRTFDVIRSYSRQRPLIVLPSHDPDSPRRLLEGISFQG